MIISCSTSINLIYTYHLESSFIFFARSRIIPRPGNTWRPIWDSRASYRCLLIISWERHSYDKVGHPMLTVLWLIHYDRLFLSAAVSYHCHHWLSHSMDIAIVVFCMDSVAAVTTISLVICAHRRDSLCAHCFSSSLTSSSSGPNTVQSRWNLVILCSWLFNKDLIICHILSL